MVAQSAFSQFSNSHDFDCIHFIPSGNPPHKRDGAELLDITHRLKMVELAVADNPHFAVSPIEANTVGTHYTIETLAQLQETSVMEPPFPFIIGTDALAGLPGWKAPEALIEQLCFLQVTRPGSPFLKTLTINGRKHTLQTHAVAMPPMAVSASWIRGNLLLPPISSPEDAPSATDKAGALRYFLPEPVRHYIAEKALYSIS